MSLTQTHSPVEKSHGSKRFQGFPIRAMQRGWTPCILLAQQGYFNLRDVTEILEINTAKVKAAAFDVAESGEKPLELIGVCCSESYWIIHMPVFSDYYLQHLMPRVRAVAEAWDGNDLLAENGIFYLNDVCKKIPFTRQQLRYRSIKLGKEKTGIWKDEAMRVHLVDMQIFGPWITRMWCEMTGKTDQ